MCNGGDDGIVVEAFEVLPRRLAPIDDGVRTRWPIVGLRSYLYIDAVKQWPNSGHHGVELSPLGLCLQLQHVELGLGPSTVFYKHREDPSSE